MHLRDIVKIKNDKETWKVFSYKDIRILCENAINAVETFCNVFFVVMSIAKLLFWCKLRSLNYCRKMINIMRTIP